MIYKRLHMYNAIFSLSLPTCKLDTRTSEPGVGHNLNSKAPNSVLVASAKATDTEISRETCLSGSPILGIRKGSNEERH